MDLNRFDALCESARKGVRCALSALVVVLSTPAIAQVWWDNFPRVVSTTFLSTAQGYGANAAMNGVAQDPDWGLWFTFGNDDGAGGSNTCASFQAAGIVSVAYNTGYGCCMNPINGLQWNSAGYLQPGENALGATVLFYGAGGGTWPLGKPGFLLWLEVEYARPTPPASAASEVPMSRRSSECHARLGTRWRT